jgi:hypothetical protein
LRWVSDQLRASEIFRADLPRFSSSTQRDRHLAQLRQELLAEWDRDVLARYFARLDGTAEARPYAGLPWTVTPSALPTSPQAKLKLTAPRPLDLQVVAGVIEFSCHSKRWRFASEALLILRPLAERRSCSVAELCEAAAGRLDEQTVRAFLRELILGGLVAVVEE